MPLEERVLQPICVSRGIIDDQKTNYNLLPNELECFTNGTLANIIKQLSSLSMYAEDLFASILLDAGNLINRTNTLQQKVNNLAIKVTQLDSTNEDISLHDIHLKKPYKPQNTTIQEIFSKKTMPKSIQELYQQCSKPPSLYLLNPFRDDGKDSMKFYTNPNFFFELWRDDMLKKQVEKEKNNKKLAHRTSNKMQNGPIDANKKPRQPANSNERYRKMVSQQEFLIGEDLPNGNVIYMSNDEAHYDQFDSSRSSNQMDVYGTYNGSANATINQQQQQQQQIQQQLHYAYHNGTIPHHQHLHQQINGNANFINQLNSMTPPPSYTQIQSHQFNQQQQMQQDQFNQHHIQQQQQNMHTLSRRTSRPSQPPPEPPALTNGHQMNGHLSHNEYHQTNGFINHYNQSNHHSHQTNGYVNHYSQSNQHQLNQQQQTNLNLSNNSTNELVHTKRPQLGMPPPVPNMINNSNDNNSFNNNNLPLPPPMPINVNGQLVSSANLKEQKAQPPAPPPLPPPMPSNPQQSDNANTNNTNNTTNNNTNQNANQNANNNTNNTSISNNRPSSIKGTTFEQEILQKQKQLQPVKNINRPPPKSDPRNDLLASIREGIKLRKVEDSKQKEIEKNENLLDVASILARRVAMELSDSESNDSDDSDNDDWNDESHV